MGVETSLHGVELSDLDGDTGEILDRLEDRPCHHLGKAWDAVHFALGRHEGDHPLAFIESGGADVDELEDGIMAYGRFFAAPAVVGIASALARVTEAELRANFALRENVDDQDSLYPTGFAPFEAEDIVRAVARLRPFLAKVIAAKLGLLVYTSG